jgi:hypothetical protein
VSFKNTLEKGRSSLELCHGSIVDALDWRSRVSIGSTWAGSRFMLDVVVEAAPQVSVSASCIPLCCCKCALCLVPSSMPFVWLDPAVSDATCDPPVQSMQARLRPKNDAGAWHYACLHAVTPTTSRPSITPPAESRRWAVVESWQECRLLPCVA